jgi:hypothetical protein
MIPKTREVRLKPKLREVLEARCRAPSTAQSQAKRARIVLLAAEDRSTRSIAQDVGVQPRIVSNWRRRFADHGLAGLAAASLSVQLLRLTFVEEDIWVFTTPSCAALAVFTNDYSEPNAITPMTSLASSA